MGEGEGDGTGEGVATCLEVERGKKATRSRTGWLLPTPQEQHCFLGNQFLHLSTTDVLGGMIPWCVCVCACAGGGGLSCTLYCRMSSTTFDLYPLDTSSTLSCSVVTTKNVSGHGQMSPGGHIAPSQELLQEY